MSARECGFTGCGRPHLAKNYCRAHYYQLRRGEELREVKPKGQRSWRENRPGRPRPAATLAWQYGMSPYGWDLLLASQGGVCAICRGDTPGGHGTWHVDHDHACCPGRRACGRCVRGLLCHRCNIMLGMARDDPLVLATAVDYLAQHATAPGSGPWSRRNTSPATEH